MYNHPWVLSIHTFSAQKCIQLAKLGNVSTSVMSFIVILKRLFFKLLSLIYVVHAIPGQQQPICFCVDVLQAAHNDKSAVSCKPFLTHTSASDRDNTSTPHFSPLFLRSSSKGSMRMTVFRPGVRPFSTFSISIVAFWGVSQMTTGISAENTNQARGHQPTLLNAWLLCEGVGADFKVKPSRSLNEITSANEIYRVQAKILY